MVNEVVRTLSYDLEEKHIRLQVQGDQLSIQADEQLLRQALFNLLLNAIQAVNGAGEIQIFAQKSNASEALLEVRDTGPGVPADRRTETRSGRSRRGRRSWSIRAATTRRFGRAGTPIESSSAAGGGSSAWR